MTPLKTLIEEEKKQFIEKGADIEHERWSKWQAYLHSRLDFNGTDWVLKNEWFERWNRQIHTPYCNLTENEKESDREQVRSYETLLTTAMQRTYEAGRADWLRSEIEKLNDVSRDWIAEATHNSDNFEVRIKLDVLDSIITRYKEELKVLTGE